MKILKLQFKNLNSLLGEWSIDFTNEAYLTEGIFAITGPTGSGKSTILDAICLALYGQTPRLKTISKSTNEIMSRQAGECYARVIFETTDNKYQITWAQHKTRKKPDGTLQQQTHEILNLDTMKIESSKIEDVKQKITDITGMDYNRFTKSILLAQGQFDLFLNASADERSPILEDITGTQIYTEISKKAFNKAKSIENELSLLIEKRKTYNIPDEEETREQDKTYTSLIDNKKSLQLKLDKITDQLNKYKMISELKDRIEINRTNLQEALIEKDKNKDKFIKYENAIKTLDIKSVYDEITNLREQIKQSEDNIEKYKNKLSTDLSELETLEENHKKIDKELENKNKYYEDEKTVIKETISLDIKNDEITNQISNLTKKKDRLDESIKNSENEKISFLNKLKEITTDKETAQQYISNNKSDETLSNNLQLIQNYFEIIKNSNEEITNHNNTIDDLESNIKLQQNNIKKYNDSLDSINNQIEQLNIKISDLEADYNQYPAIKELNKQKEKTNSLIETLNEIKKIMVEIEKFNENINTADKKIESINLEKEKLENDKIINSKDIEINKSEIEKIKAYSTINLLRKNLEKNKPCDVCGSIEHPYIDSNNGPIADHTDLNLTEYTQKLKENEHNKEIILAEITKHETTKDHILNEKIQAHENIKKHNQTLSEINKFDFKDLSTVQNEIELKIDMISKIDKQIFESYELEEQIKILSDKIKLLKNEKESKLNDKNNLTNNLTKDEEKLKSIQSSRNKTKTVLEENNNILEEKLSGYNIKFKIDDFSNLLENIKERIRIWDKNISFINKSDTLLSELNANIKNNEQNLLNLNTELEELENLLLTAKKNQKDNRDKRFSIFQDKDPEIYEIELSNEIKNLESQSKKSFELCNSMKTDITKSQENIDFFKKSITENNNKLNTKATDFTTYLKDNGFESEEDFKNSLMDAAERKNIEKLKLDLTRKIEEMENTISNDQEQIEKISTELETQTNYDNLLTEKQNIQNQVENIQSQIAEIKIRKENYEKSKNEISKLNEQIKSLNKDSLIFNKLRSLIGSADGKVYRMFAQGITFDYLIHNANLQLQRLTERYSLVQDENLPLEFSIIDNYQAGEIRTTKNLSGGESFIVSLALALGLSNMITGKIKVDSLFLDEGFGTLDEDALETALETLSNLNQEGKTICIISHVPALKERINTQITINPIANGNSNINGPGVQNI